MNPMLLGIHGLKGSGKDTVADMLGRYLLDHRKFSFGDRLKRICSEAFDVPLTVFYQVALKEDVYGATGRTPRSMMTSMSDALKNQYGDGFFAKDLPAYWYLCKSKGFDLLVTDVRHDVEASVLATCGGTMLHVLRPGSSLYQDFSHISEGGLKINVHDHVIHNDGTKLELLLKVREFLLKWKGPNALDLYPYVPNDAFGF